MKHLVTTCLVRTEEFNWKFEDIDTGHVMGMSALIDDHVGKDSKACIIWSTEPIPEGESVEFKLLHIEHDHYVYKSQNNLLFPIGWVFEEIFPRMHYPEKFYIRILNVK